jgi:dTDP-4-dehydrorhamnose reductase
MTKLLVIIGSTGQLGSDLMRLWPASLDENLVGLTHSEIEVTNIDSVRATLGQLRPAVVVNTSAYHKVDEVEHNVDRAFAVNAIGPNNLAIVCSEIDAMLIHWSTDYVFGGRKSSPYLESDPVDPINTYGVSKAAGEMLVRTKCRKHFIIRTSGLYGVAGPSGKGTNFVELMLQLARAGKPIRVVNDQVLTPTPTHLLADPIAALSRTDAYGTYHATCQGQCSWYDFARAIFAFAGLSPRLSSQTTTQSGAIATRPSYSVLANKNLGKLGIDRMPEWQMGLQEYLGKFSSREDPMREWQPQPAPAANRIQSRGF